MYFSGFNFIKKICKYIKNNSSWVSGSCAWSSLYDCKNKINEKPNNNWPENRRGIMIGWTKLISFWLTAWALKLQNRSSFCTTVSKLITSEPSPGIINPSHQIHCQKERPTSIATSCHSKNQRVHRGKGKEGRTWISVTDKHAKRGWFIHQSWFYSSTESRDLRILILRVLEVQSWPAEVARECARP